MVVVHVPFVYQDVESTQEQDQGEHQGRYIEDEMGQTPEIQHGSQEVAVLEKHFWGVPLLGSRAVFKVAIGRTTGARASKRCYGWCFSYALRQVHELEQAEVAIELQVRVCVHQVLLLKVLELLRHLDDVLV